jgi:hypothetical protein
MAANALDTLRLIGKTLVVEYNAKTPSRLKVRERGGEERGCCRGESRGGEARSMAKRRSNCLLSYAFGGSLDVPRPVLISIALSIATVRSPTELPIV